MKKIISAFFISALLTSLTFALPVDNDQYEKLVSCVKYNNMEKAEKLLEKGYKPDAKSISGKTIVMYCLLENKPEFARFFLENGASLDITDNKGNTPLHYAIENCEDKSIIKEMVNLGAPLEEANDEGYTPFHFSILFACPEIPFYLLNQKVNYKSITQLNENALHLSIEAGCDSLTDYLLESDINYDLADVNGNTPLLLAVKYNDTITATLLINAGAQLNRTDVAGNSILQYAFNNADLSLAHYLVKQGVSLEQDPGEIPYLTLAADHEDIPLITDLLKAGAVIPQVCEFHEQCYNTGLLNSLYAEMADKPEKTNSYKKSFKAFMQAHSGYYDELEDLKAAKEQMDLWQSTSGQSTYQGAKYDPDELVRKIAYFEERLKLTEEQILAVKKQLKILDPGIELPDFDSSMEE